MHAYQRIERYKGELMGIAILIVVYGHLLYYHSGLLDYEYLHISEWYTVGSVDIFLFLSGFGIYHSLQKNDNPLSFMLRRINRLLPAFLPIILLYCGYLLVLGRMTVWQALGNLTTMGWWTQMGRQFNWYIPTLLVLYLVSPLMFGILKRYGRKALWLFLFLFLLDAACVGTGLMVGGSRFPVYFLGMFLAQESERGPSRRHLILSGVMLIVSMCALYILVTQHPGSLKRLGFWWHPFLLSTPGCIYLTTWCLEKHELLAPGRWLNRGLACLGRFSFEIYLCHLMVYTVAYYTGVQGWIWWILMAFCGLGVGMLYGNLIEFLRMRLNDSKIRPTK